MARRGCWCGTSTRRRPRGCWPGGTRRSGTGTRRGERLRAAATRLPPPAGPAILGGLGERDDEQSEAERRWQRKFNAALWVGMAVGFILTLYLLCAYR